MECPYCGKGFKDKAAFLSHVRNKHPEQYQHLKESLDSSANLKSDLESKESKESEGSKESKESEGLEESKFTEEMPSRSHQAPPETPSREEVEEGGETEKAPKKGTVTPTVDTEGKWVSVYLPHLSFEKYGYIRDKFGDCDSLSNFIVNAIDFYFEHYYGLRYTVQEITPEELRLRTLKEKNFSKEELDDLLKLGRISQEEYNILTGKSGGE